MSICQYRKCHNSLIGLNTRGGRKRIYCGATCRELETAARRSESRGVGTVVKPEIQQEKKYQREKEFHLDWLKKPLGVANG